jgi:hypothetical protein
MHEGGIEREREREKSVCCILYSVTLHVSKATIITATRMVFLVTSEREKENTSVKDLAKSSGKVANSSLEIKAPKDFIRCKLVLVLR